MNCIAIKKEWQGIFCPKYFKYFILGFWMQFCVYRLRSSIRYAILEIRKRESHRSGYPSEKQHLMLYSISRHLFAVVGGYFFPLKI